MKEEIRDFVFGLYEENDDIYDAYRVSDVILEYTDIIFTYMDKEIIL